jgi:hypothetical protein
MKAPDTGSHALPPLYNAWIGELLQGPIPAESRATCDHCAMLSDSPGSTESEAQSSSNDYYFDPNVKCCTYVPILHNFLVGRILTDTDPSAEQGRSTVLKRLNDGVGVTPLGLNKPAVFSLLYDHADAGSFGRARNLRCPHYIDDGGRCGVWRHRSSTCATWFCKHVRGSVGFDFWRKSLHPLLQAIEREISRWCLLELNPGEDALRHLITAAYETERSDLLSCESLDHRVDPNLYARIWGKWKAREQEFFIDSARLVDELSWNDVLKICGPEVGLLARLTVDAYKRLISDELPQSVKVGPMQLVQITRNAVRVTTYSEFDPIDIPGVVLDVLPYFGGRTTVEALTAIESEKGIRLDPALISKMVDFSLLRPQE